MDLKEQIAATEKALYKVEQLRGAVFFLIGRLSVVDPRVIDDDEHREEILKRLNKEFEGADL